MATGANVKHIPVFSETRRAEHELDRQISEASRDPLALVLGPTDNIVWLMGSSAESLKGLFPGRSSDDILHVGEYSRISLPRDNIVIGGVHYSVETLVCEGVVHHVLVEVRQ